MSEPRTKQAFRFRFRVTTPLFLGGAAPDQRAELRPPAIKGVLRDWYRVLVGLEAAARNEAQRFGGTGAGAGQSPFLLAIDRPLVGEERWQPPRAGRHEISGLGYLGYTLELGRKPGTGRKAIASGTPFELEAFFPRGPADGQDRVLLGSLWLLTHLGGLGTRSRRGFGSLALEQWKGPDDGDLDLLPLLSTSADPRDVGTSLRRGLEILEEWFPLAAEQSAAEPPPLGLRLAGARLLVVREPLRGGAWQRPLDVLDYVGAEMQRFRRQADLDGFATAQKLARREPLPVAPRRTAFGLPLSYRSQAVIHTFEPYLPGSRREPKSRGELYRRFPSPLLFHVQKVRGGFVALVTLLAGAWPGRDLPVHTGGQSCAADPDNAVLGTFLDRLVDQGAEEVRW